MLSRIVCVAAFSAAGVWNAYAADLPVARPAAVVAPVLVWTGCYVGVHGGGGVIGGGGGGAIAGGQIGCNYQTGRLVFGLEAEGFWSSLEDTTGESSSSLFGSSTFTSTNRNEWDADLALRLGFTPFDQLLVYGKLGIAVGGFEFTRSFAFTSAFDSSFTNTVATATLWGPMVGLGGEYALSPNWSAKVEYNYIKFLNERTTFTTCGASTGVAFACTTSNSTVNAEKHLIKVGFNYRFTGR